ncbi:MAG TPA: metalloregulator ArsR/SmtB family transcription factor [Vicinamibacterales bacterium]|jgi:ArsR family transcriptional regulator|nr:metalloregulator ArsR/SmtB family transcription factor [Vicinamibacterales bacterium]
MSRELQTVEQVFKALADPTRIRIIGLLLSGEVCVCHIHESLDIPQSKASRHLAYLRRTGMVAAEKRGLWVHYRMADMPSGVAQTLVEAVKHCIGHLPEVRKDGARLEKRTGCGVPLPGAVMLDCCAPKR